MSVKTKIDESLFSDQKSLNATLCVIRAIYKLSYNHYLQVNALSESDLNKEDGAYRQLTSWPSQSRFIFSLEQMRDAYERLGNNPIAKQLLTEEQIQDTQKRKKSKEGFWTILGEAEDAFKSFRILENDQSYDTQRLETLRNVSYAYRLVLFQTKISEFRETGNFLALLRSADKELAKEAFQNCAHIVPLPPGFFSKEGIVQEDNCKSQVAQLKAQLQEKEVLLQKYRENSEEMIRQVNTTLSDMQETKIYTTELIAMLKDTFSNHQNFCKEIQQAKN